MEIQYQNIMLIHKVLLENLKQMQEKNKQLQLVVGNLQNQVRQKANQSKPRGRGGNFRGKTELLQKLKQTGQQLLETKKILKPQPSANLLKPWSRSHVRKVLKTTNSEHSWQCLG